MSPRLRCIKTPFGAAGQQSTSRFLFGDKTSQPAQAVAPVRCARKAEMLRPAGASLVVTRGRRLLHESAL